MTDAEAELIAQAIGFMMPFLALGLTLWWWDRKERRRR